MYNMLWLWESICMCKFSTIYKSYPNDLSCFSPKHDQWAMTCEYNMIDDCTKIYSCVYTSSIKCWLLKAYLLLTVSQWFLKTLVETGEGVVPDPHFSYHDTLVLRQYFSLFLDFLRFEESSHIFLIHMCVWYNTSKKTLQDFWWDGKWVVVLFNFPFWA